jgi:hypothetical protein
MFGMKIVPLHCVVLTIGQPTSPHLFPSHEILYTRAIANELTGGADRQGLAEASLAEVHHRMGIKLRLGERVIILAHDLTRQERMALATSATSQGVPVFYILSEDMDRETMRGDGVAEVIDTRHHEIQFVRPFEHDLFPQVSAKWRGITAIGDIHGMHSALLAALSWARARNHFVIFLGDVVDYGPGTLEVADEVYRVITRGEGAAVLGNHERKIMRWIDGGRVRLSDGNKVTTSALQSVGETAKKRWIGRFRGLYQNSRLIVNVGPLTFVHGAIHSAMWKTGVVDKYVENHAFFGEIDDNQSQSDKVIRSYRWIDAIPTGQTVVVGHDIRSRTHPFVQKNDCGGNAVFLDTGSGKGGHLSSADFRFVDGDIQLKNFTVH